MAESTQSAIRGALPAIVGSLVVGAVLGAGVMYFLKPGPTDSPDSSRSQIESPKNVSALGRIQPAGGLLTLTTPMPDQVIEVGSTMKEVGTAHLILQSCGSQALPPGSGALAVASKILFASQVAELPAFLPRKDVIEGKKIEKGETVVVLSGHAEHRLKWELAKIQLQDAKKQLVSIKISANLKIKTDQLQIDQIEKLWPSKQELQKAKIDFLAAKLDTAEKNLKAVEGLNFISRQEKEEKQLLILGLKNQLRGAKIESKQLTEGHGLELEAAKAALAASKAKKEQALQQLSIESLEKHVALAKSMYDRTIVKAPRTGKVIALFAQVGELVGGIQPILTMADTDNMMVIAEVYETDRHKVHQDQQVEIKGRAIKDGKLTGKVVHISDRIGRNKVAPSNPLEKVDRRVVEVKIQLDDNEQASSLINHQVTVTFLSKEQ